MMEQAHIGQCLSHLKTGDNDNALRCIDSAVSCLQTKIESSDNGES